MYKYMTAKRYYFIGLLGEVLQLHLILRKQHFDLAEQHQWLYVGGQHQFVKIVLLISSLFRTASDKTLANEATQNPPKSI